MLLALAVVMSINLSAQISKNIVDTTKQWNVLIRTTMAESTMSYRISAEDTIINGQKYNILQTSYTYMPIETYEWNNMSSYIREDSGRVYVYTDGPLFCGNDQIDESGEYLLYDFNLSVGDSITLWRELESYYPAEVGGRFVVENIDSILVGGEYLKRFHMCRVYNVGTYFVEYWIEGIGSTTDFLLSTCMWYEWSHYLLCVKQAEDVIYSHPDYSSCYISVGIEDIDGYEDIMVNPNLITSSCSIRTSLSNYSIKLFSIDGQVQKTRNNCNGITELNLSDYTKGLYLLLIFDDKNNLVKSQKLVKI